MWRLLCLMLCLLLPPVAQAEGNWWDKLFGAPVEKGSGLLVEPLSDTSPAGGLVPPSPLSLPNQGAAGALGAPVLSLASDYKLGPGDRVSITVFNEKDLTVDARLSDAGTLSLPLLGEIRVQGMTIGMLQDYLTEQLKGGFLVNPQLYVSILEYRQFFVNGEVNKPGGLSYQPGLTVRKAIALAGGFTARASYTKIFVIHEDDPFGRPRAVSLDTFLRPGDILTIEQSFF